MNGKIDDTVAKINEAIETVKKLMSNGVTFAQKVEIVKASAELHNWIMKVNIIDHNCATCDHCVSYEGNTCCAARKMAPIPFNVINRVGGCSMWYEKDFIPF